LRVNWWCIVCPKSSRWFTVSLCNFSFIFFQVDYLKTEIYNIIFHWFGHKKTSFTHYIHFMSWRDWIEENSKVQGGTCKPCLRFEQWQEKLSKPIIVPLVWSPNILCFIFTRHQYEKMEYWILSHQIQGGFQ